MTDSPKPSAAPFAAQSPIAILRRNETETEVLVGTFLSVDENDPSALVIDVPAAGGRMALPRDQIFASRDRALLHLAEEALVTMQKVEARHRAALKTQEEIVAGAKAEVIRLRREVFGDPKKAAPAKKTSRLPGPPATVTPISAAKPKRTTTPPKAPPTAPKPSGKRVGKGRGK